MEELAAAVQRLSRRSPARSWWWQPHAQRQNSSALFAGANDAANSSSPRRRRHRRHRSPRRPARAAHAHRRHLERAHPQSFRILSLVAQQHASDAAPGFRVVAEEQAELLDTFRVLLSKSANTASLALAFGFWSFEETLCARKMQHPQPEAAGKWLSRCRRRRPIAQAPRRPRPPLAGGLRGCHALLPLNIGLGIRVIPQAGVLAHEASRPPPARWSAWRRRRHAVRAAPPEDPWQAWSTFYLNHVIRLQWAIERVEEGAPDRGPSAASRCPPGWSPDGCCPGRGGDGGEGEPAAASGGRAGGAAGAYDVGVAVQAAVSTELLRAEKLAPPPPPRGGGDGRVRGGGGAAAADGGGAAEGEAGPEERGVRERQRLRGVWSLRRRPYQPRVGASRVQGEGGRGGQGCDGAAEARRRRRRRGRRARLRRGGGGRRRERGRGGGRRGVRR